MFPVYIFDIIFLTAKWRKFAIKIVSRKNRVNYHKKLQDLLDAGADVDIKENDENIKKLKLEFYL